MLGAKRNPGEVDNLKDIIRRQGRLNLAQARLELKPLLEIKGELEALEKIEKKIATVGRRLQAKS